MIKINWLQIVPSLCLIFTFFLPYAYSAPIDWVKQQASSGGYVIGRLTDMSLSLRFQNETVQVDPDGYFVIGFDREMGGLFELSWLRSDVELGLLPIWVSSREFNVQSIQGVAQNLVTPPASVARRIQREAEQVNQARAGGFVGTSWRDGPFVWPLFGRVTGVYGSQRIYNGTPGNPHWGIDIAAPSGTPVYAPAAGKITLAEPDLYFSGGTIVLDHGGGLTSSFLHLSALNVIANQLVAQGDIIAWVGSTGRSTGPHLDWRMNLNGARIDAGLWVPGQSQLCLDQSECRVPDGLSAIEQAAWRLNRDALLQRE